MQVKDEDEAQMPGISLALSCIRFSPPSPVWRGHITVRRACGSSHRAAANQRKESKLRSLTVDRRSQRRVKDNRQKMPIVGCQGVRALAQSGMSFVEPCQSKTSPLVSGRHL